jgi:GT2 family glycosyltransferase
MTETGARPMTAATVERPEPAVGIIVLNWKGETDTSACLDSVLAQRGVRMELVLIDNASPDGSGARLHEQYPALPYLEMPENLGYAGGNNRGLEWAMDRGCEWLLVVNNDTVADRDCVRRLLDAAQRDERIGALAPLIVRYDDPARVWFAGGRHDRVRAIGVHMHWNALAQRVERERDGSAWLPCTFLTGCCLLLRAEAVRDVGMFRADFFAYVEDLELSLRLQEAGWHLGWVPAARLAHRVPPLSAEPTPMQIWLRDRNRRRLVRDRYSAVWRALFALWFWPTRLILLARFALRRDWARARAIVTGMTAP